MDLVTNKTASNPLHIETVKIDGETVGTIRPWGVGPCFAFTYRGSKSQSGVANTRDEAISFLKGNAERVARQGR